MKIIQFPSYYNNYKFLYYRGKNKKMVFDIWGKDYKEVHKVYLYVKKHFNLTHYAALSSSMKIDKKFMPVPGGKKLNDGYVHEYVEGELLY